MARINRSQTRVSPLFDVVVIGGGSAGMAAVDGAKAGGAKSICVIEAEARLGGECAYWACIPTKAMLKAAKLYHTAKYGLGKYGIRASRVHYDFPSLIQRRDAVIQTITTNGKRLSDRMKHLGVTVKHGPAHFWNDKTLDVKGERIRGKAFVIATGSIEREPLVDGWYEIESWSSRDVVAMKSLPSSVAILGGGPIGCEFATLFGLLGVKTTLLEYGEHILPREDAEIASLAEAQLRHLGVGVFTNTKPLGVKRSGGKSQVTFQVGRKPRQTIMVDRVIAAVGRKPNFTHLALERAKLKVDSTGKLDLKVNLQTTQPHIFVAGDANSRYQFTHIANHEGYIAGWNAAQVRSQGQHLRVEENVVPRITFVDPEVASVGMTAAAASKAKKKVKVYQMPFNVLGRAAIEGHRDGLIKIVVDAKRDRVLGAHVMGERAGEIVHELALAMYGDIPFTTVRSMLHAYPSWSEIIPAADS